ncbi:probable very-long-chain enoyl-CoA reductase art-1 [Oscarella lobularis]|uniref:probable very-long-chain enoyl-CoA reductase art-1 n=1 Tax=Oscarella lobularis TaxID=121494 RepID=UPI0033133DA2
MDLTVEETRSKRSIQLSNIPPDATVCQLKDLIHKKHRKYHPSRTEIRLSARDKGLKEEETLESRGITSGSTVYLKDLGPQIGWTTVFLIEYTGPLVLYLIFYMRPSLIYGGGASAVPYHAVVHLAAACWSFHYAKRLLETVFVHRFSHGTMPLFNLFKNSGYYWSFASYIAYYVNHPLYTAPSFGWSQIYVFFALFAVSEVGNLSAHLLLKNLRPPGTTTRRIPRPDYNPLNGLFNYVSCPNYTYEIMAWIAFTGMTQTLAAAFFTLAGFAQMATWALGKHRNYRREFPEYPKGRKAIVPWLL